jgi:hypothetical protein
MNQERLAEIERLLKVATEELSRIQKQSRNPEFNIQAGASPINPMKNRRYVFFALFFGVARIFMPGGLRAARPARVVISLTA